MTADGVVRALADGFYKDGYDTTTERLFALLVDVARAYESDLEGRYGRAVARGSMLQGLEENLEVRDATPPNGPA